MTKYTKRGTLEFNKIPHFKRYSWHLTLTMNAVSDSSETHMIHVKIDEMPDFEIKEFVDNELLLLAISDIIAYIKVKLNEHYKKIQLRPEHIESSLLAKGFTKII